MENLRLGSGEMDDHEGYSATEYIQQHRISQFDVGPLDSVFIRKFFNIHMGKHYGENYKDLDQADVPFQDDVLGCPELFGSKGKLEQDNGEASAFLEDVLESPELLGSHILAAEELFVTSSGS